MGNGDYNITSGGYYWRGKNNFVVFAKYKLKSNLFYSAFEFRNCIERILIEYFILLKINNVPKNISKLYRAKDIGSMILEIEPNFYKKLNFMNIYLEAINVPNRISIPNLQILNTHYGLLGNYLHSLKEPNETVNSEKWWQSFYKDVSETEKYLYSILSDNFGAFNLNERGLKLFEKWNDGCLSKKDVIKEIHNNTGKE